MTTWLVLWTALVCAVHGLPLENALAVMLVESRPVVNGEIVNVIRVGRLGSSPYYGPCGVRWCSKGADDPETNIVLGVRAMARYSDFKRSMQRYNASFDYAYYHEIWKWIKFMRGRGERQ